MNHRWVICLAREDAASLGQLRLTAGVEVGEQKELVWVRGPHADEHLTKTLRALPAIARYEILSDKSLRNIEARIPTAALPDLRWQPIAAWIQAEFPVAALPAFEPRPISLRLVRSSDERGADLLLTALEEWTRFGDRAPLGRLQRLRFAAAGDGLVLVRGTPLPPLPGCRFVVHGSIAVPAGFTWRSEVGLDVLTRRFGASAEALVLWREDGTIARLHGEQFVQATRSAIRATAQAASKHT